VVVPDGTPTVLFFFATNCATCVVTAEAMGQLDRTLAGRVSFVAIDLVPNDDRAVIGAFRNAVGNPAYPIVVDRTGEFLERYAITALDTTLVIDADGTLAWRSDGRPLDRDALRSALRTAGVAS